LREEKTSAYPIGQVSVPFAVKGLIGTWCVPASKSRLGRTFKNAGAGNARDDVTNKVLPSNFCNSAFARSNKKKKKKKNNNNFIVVFAIVVDDKNDDDGEVVFVDDVFPLLLFFLCASSSSPRAQTRARFCKTKALLKGQMREDSFSSTTQFFSSLFFFLLTLI
tara:strand:- start:594 stop:1085 length:492 start_codon:yes stop_codon:yes gene_type:complete